MAAAEHPALLSERRHHVVDDLVLVARARMVVRDIQRVTADESDTEHDGRHVAGH